jgi:hypothetical protein
VSRKMQVMSAFLRIADTLLCAQVRFFLRSTTCVVALSGCLSSAPSMREWELSWTSPDGLSYKYRVSTTDLYTQHSLARGSVLEGHRRDAAASASTEGLRSVEVDGATLLAEPRGGPGLRVRNTLTNVVLGSVRTGHSYSFLLAISPCGDYLLYNVPGLFWRRYYVHHWRTDRRAVLRLPERGALVSWREVGHSNAAVLDKTSRRLERSQ